MSEIYLKLMLVQMMTESTPASIHFLLLLRNHIQMKQQEQDPTLSCMGVSKSIGTSKWQHVDPAWAGKQGFAKRWKRCTPCSSLASQASTTDFDPSAESIDREAVAYRWDCIWITIYYVHFFRHTLFLWGKFMWA